MGAEAMHRSSEWEVQHRTHWFIWKAVQGLEITSPINRTCFSSLNSEMARKLLQGLREIGHHWCPISRKPCSITETKETIENNFHTHADALLVFDDFNRALNMSNKCNIFYFLICLAAIINLKVVQFKFEKSGLVRYHSLGQVQWRVDLEMIIFQVNQSSLGTFSFPRTALIGELFFALFLQVRAITKRSTTGFQSTLLLC